MISPAALLVVLVTPIAAFATEGGQTARALPENLRILSSLGGVHPLAQEPLKCGLPVITAALRRRDELSAAQRSALAAITDRTVRQVSVLSGHFRIHFDTSGADAPALLDAAHQPIAGSARVFVDSVASIAAYVYDFETRVLGYTPPPPDGTLGGGPEYDIYIQDLGSLYGQTVPDGLPLDGGTSTTSITIDNDFIFVNPPSNRGLPALRVTLAHEFHHAIQLGSYAYWMNDIYFYEITSTWLEDVLYTDVNDYYNYLRSFYGHFNNPGTAFTTADGAIEYSRAIWGHFIAKKFGRDAMRRTWEEIRQMRPILGIDAALRSYSSSFASAFAEWSMWNYFTAGRANPQDYYPEGANYPLVAMASVAFTPPSRELAGTLDDLGNSYYQVLSTADTVVLIVSNTNVTASLNPAPSSFAFTYLLNTVKLDDAYIDTRAGIYVKLNVADPANWGTWFVVAGSPYQGGGASALQEGTPFPNPFRADGRALVSIPVAAVTTVPGTLKIFSSSMLPVYDWSGNSVSVSGRQAFVWNGTTSGNLPAATGVYVFALVAGGKTITGKIALIRK